MHYVGNSYSFAVVSMCEYIASYLFFQIVEDNEDSTWDVLWDNYMMGSTMKGWDRDSNSVTEHNSDTNASCYSSLFPSILLMLSCIVIPRGLLLTIDDAYTSRNSWTWISGQLNLQEIETLTAYSCMTIVNYYLPLN